MFKSGRYWRAMNYLASPSFNAQTMMGTLPIQHYVSVALDNNVKEIEKIKPATGKKPMHVNLLLVKKVQLFQYLVGPDALFCKEIYQQRFESPF